MKKTFFLLLAAASIISRPLLAQSSDSLPTGCQLWFNLGMDGASNGDYAFSYDTLKAFVQTCPTNVNAPGAFGIMNTDVQDGGDGTSPQCWIDFRGWLLSALSWNPNNPTYFCADVNVIGGTFSSLADTSWQQINTATNKAMSVLYWILHNPLCTNSYDSQYYAQGRGSQIQSWESDVDTSKVPLDTTIYTMQQLGLDSILKYAGLLGVNEGTVSIITNPSVYPNPTGEGTVLSFGTTKEAYVLVQVYDILGHETSAAEFGNVLEAGNHEVPISLAGLPSGTYFARIQTTYGEAQTVKVVKQ